MPSSHLWFLIIRVSVRSLNASYTLPSRMEPIYNLDARARPRLQQMPVYSLRGRTCKRRYTQRLRGLRACIETAIV